MQLIYIPLNTSYPSNHNPVSSFLALSTPHFLLLTLDPLCNTLTSPSTYLSTLNNPTLITSLLFLFSYLNSSYSSSSSPSLSSSLSYFSSFPLLLLLLLILLFFFTSFTSSSILTTLFTLVPKTLLQTHQEPLHY